MEFLKDFLKYTLIATFIMGIVTLIALGIVYLIHISLWYVLLAIPVGVLMALIITRV